MAFPPTSRIPVTLKLLNVTSLLPPQMSSPLAAPGLAVGRALRPKFVPTLGFATVVTMVFSTGTAPVAVKKNEMSLPLVSAWLGAN